MAVVQDPSTSLYKVTVAASVVVNVNVGVLLDPGDDGEIDTYARVGGAVSITIAF
jgi:hypothetical protein